MSFPYVFPIILDNGGVNAVNIKFDVLAKEEVTQDPVVGANGSITITKPDMTTEVFTVVTDANGTYTKDVVYTVPGDYSAVVHLEKSGFDPADSNVVSFTVTVANKKMVVTLNVSVT